jgi:hypothetical protein
MVTDTAVHLMGFMPLRACCGRLGKDRDQEAIVRSCVLHPASSTHPADEGSAAAADITRYSTSLQRCRTSKIVVLVGQPSAD